MNKLNLITFASQLNKQGDIRTAHSQLMAVLDAHYQVNIVTPSQVATLAPGELQLVFISSGGAENQFRDNYAQLPHPVVLLTDGLQNSLAASLEISSWVRNQGASCHIIHGDEATIVHDLQVLQQQRLLQGKRIGVIGEPSAWLIASGVDREAASERWGVTFDDVTLDEVEQTLTS